VTTGPAWLLWGLLALLAIATVGEGGAQPTSMMAEHAILFALVVTTVVRGARSSGAAVVFRLDRGVAYAWIAFLIAAATGAVVAPYGFASWLVLVELAAFTGVLVLSARVGPGLLPPLGAALGAVGAAQALFAIGQHLSGRALRAGGGFLNPNDLAAWLIAAMFVCGGTLLARGRSARTAGLLAALPLLLALWFIGSRGAVIGLFAGAVVAGWLLRESVPAKVWRRAVAAFGLILLIGAGAVAIRFRVRDPHGLARPAIWRASLGAALARPWTGTGPGQFETAAADLNFPREDRPLRYEHAFSTPHSDLLRGPAEFGVPASFVLLATALLGLRAVAERRRTAPWAPVEVGALAALAAIGVQSAFNDFTETPGLYLLFAALLGPLVAVPVRREPGAPAWPSARWRAAAIGVGIAVFAAGDVAPYLSWRMASALPRIGLDAGQRARLARAIRLNPMQPDLFLRRAQDRLGAGATLTFAGYAAAREDAEHAIRLNPRSSVAWAALAHVEGAACRGLFGDVATRGRAEAAFAAAEDRSRHDPFLPLDAGRLLLSTGDPEGARRAAERALRIEPNAIPPRMLIAEALLAGGGAGAADAAASRIAEADTLSARYAADARESLYSMQLLTLDPGYRLRLGEAADARRSPAALDAPRARD